MTEPAPMPTSAEAVVTYALMYNPATDEYEARGERPHCPMWHLVDAEQCPAQANLWDMDGSRGVQCTRDAGHTGPHVVHAQPGLPIIAWLKR